MQRDRVIEPHVEATLFHNLRDESPGRSSPHCLHVRDSNRRLRFIMVSSTRRGGRADESRFSAPWISKRSPSAPAGRDRLLRVPARRPGRAPHPRPRPSGRPRDLDSAAGTVRPAQHPRRPARRTRRSHARRGQERDARDAPGAGRPVLDRVDLAPRRRHRRRPGRARAGRRRLGRGDVALVGRSSSDVGPRPASTAALTGNRAEAPPDRIAPFRGRPTGEVTSGPIRRAPSRPARR